MNDEVWRQYERDVAELLAELGFNISVNERIEGARGFHDVDVVARASSAGIDQMWLVECKRWSRPVPKERVLTFLSVVGDTGADRGLMFSESGYQAGAIRAAAFTNTTLTSLMDFRENSGAELAELRLKVLESKLEALDQQYLSLYDLKDPERDRILDRYIGPLDILGNRAPSGLLARLSQMREALVAARHEKWPVYYCPLDDEGDSLIKVLAVDALLYIVEETLNTCQRIYDHMLSEEPILDDWRELQSQDLTDLLSRIRQRK